MRICFSEDKEHVFFVHSDAYEYKFLSKFPAFIKQGPYHCLPAKINVVHNVVQRLQQSKKRLELDKDVYDFLQQPFVLREIPAGFIFHTKPMDYQQLSLRYLYTVGSGGLLLDPGMGKSKVVLDYIWLMGFRKTVVVCPKPLLFVWEDEIAIHRPELTFHTVTSTDWDSEKAGVASSMVTIINYTKAVLFQKELEREGFDFLHLDEFLIKDPSTDRTKSLTAIAKTVKYRCGGSGTLVNNSVLDVFSPVRYLEPSLVGWSFTNFKDKHVIKNPRDPKQVVAYTGMREARSILESCCIVMTKDKWLKLPTKRLHDIHVSLTDEQRDIYWGLTRNYTAVVQGNVVDIDNPLVMLSKLYQISNGFIYVSPTEDEPDNEVCELLADDERKKPKKKRTTIFFENSAKIRALEKLLTEKIQDRKAIIWFNMSAEYELIKALLNRIGSSYLTIRGGEANTGDKVRTFNTTPSIQWLVCQAKSVNYGITVLGTSEDKLEASGVEVMPGISPEVFTQVFYSVNFSLEVFLQQQDRIHRLGQRHDCDYYRIFASTPVELRIREAIEDKMSIRKEMLVDIAESLRKETPTVTTV